MTPIELIHALGIGIDEKSNPKEFAYLTQLLVIWEKSISILNKK
jgi:hypothetical protein